MRAFPLYVSASICWRLHRIDVKRAVVSWELRVAVQSVRVSDHLLDACHLDPDLLLVGLLWSLLISILLDVLHLVSLHLLLSIVHDIAVLLTLWVIVLLAITIIRLHLAHVAHHVRIHLVALSCHLLLLLLHHLAHVLLLFRAHLSHLLFEGLLVHHLLHLLLLEHLLLVHWLAHHFLLHAIWSGLHLVWSAHIVTSWHLLLWLTTIVARLIGWLLIRDLLLILLLLAVHLIETVIVCLFKVALTL